MTVAGAQGVVRVAHHQRCWARHQMITDPDHAQAAATLRQDRRDQSTTPPHGEVAYRDLADYDRLFGLADDLDDLDAQAV